MATFADIQAAGGALKASTDTLQSTVTAAETLLDGLAAKVAAGGPGLDPTQAQAVVDEIHAAKAAVDAATASLQAKVIADTPPA